MTKKFCDRCGAESIDQHPVVEIPVRNMPGDRQMGEMLLQLPQMSTDGGCRWLDLCRSCVDAAIAEWLLRK